MTFDERIEALLNRAGQTISDLPKRDEHFLFVRDSRSAAEHEVYCYAQQNRYLLDSLAMHQNYILHMTDVIDRMETALENVIGERDYLAERLREVDPDLCGVCVYAAQPPDAPECEQCSNREPDNFHFAGVPMDWDADAHPADH